jgi:hypothetical protein
MMMTLPDGLGWGDNWMALGGDTTQRPEMGTLHNGMAWSGDTTQWSGMGTLHNGLRSGHYLY